TLTRVIEARAKATSVQMDPSILNDPEKFKKFQEAQGELSSALGRLIAVSEAYPDLKSNQNFLALQSQLEGTENRISVARRDYIQAVGAYNTEVRTFPGMLWARFIWGAKPMETFAAAPGAQTAPAVKF
ncbi:MAG: LemA family protein, partial [Beijerinckiaceae bacterium]